MHLNTFSIVARCPRTGQLGGAVSTAVPAVGAICLFSEPGIGAASSQSWCNPYLAIDALALLAAGASGPEALDRVIAADAGRALRQFGVVDAAGRAASYTGAECTPWCGHRVGPGYAVQGNMLAGESVVAGMEAAFVAAEAEDLAERLMRALEAGQAGGGDKRGKQSAALKIHEREAYPWLDLRVDEHATPVAELRRILGIATQQLRPFIAAMPTRSGDGAPMPAEMTGMLALSPPQRPGGGGSGP
jgi:uncharacterized Ntn-hydrolase superfamily protein